MKSRRLTSFNSFLMILILVLFVPVNQVDAFESEISIDKIFSPYIRSYDKSEIVPVTDSAMLQSFYWLTPDNGDWYNMLNSKMDEFADVGFGSIWAPPMVKTADGNIPRGGYEPYDFYDLGEFDQKGGIETRFGSRIELEDMIAEANALGML